MPFEIRGSLHTLLRLYEITVVVVLEGYGRIRWNILEVRRKGHAAESAGTKKITVVGSGLAESSLCKSLPKRSVG